MELDTLRVAIVLSSASLIVALLIGWLQARQESFLIHSAAGVLAIIGALTLLGFRGETYFAEQQVVPFSLLLLGMSAIYSSTRRYQNTNASITPVIALSLALITATITPLMLGYSGVSGMMLNASCAILFWLCAYECYKAHDEAPLALLTNAAVFAITGVSFACCTYVMIETGSWVIVELPQNWAETFNSIMSLVCMTCVGAITLTLHHARSAALHKDEAHTDALTGLLNRRALFKQFNAETSFAGHAVIMFDLDHFKLINDHFGHERGDKVLWKFSGVLRDSLRGSDIVARLGGEEFCAVLKDQDIESAQLVADRVLRAYSALNIALDQTGRRATVSIGIAVGTPGENFSAALRRADKALYEAKRSGRNQVQIASLVLAA